jgi:hypothetical protein
VRASANVPERTVSHFFFHEKDSAISPQKLSGLAILSAYTDLYSLNDSIRFMIVCFEVPSYIIAFNLTLIHESSCKNFSRLFIAKHL